MIDADSKSRMRENRTYGSVRGEVSNGCPLLDLNENDVKHDKKCLINRNLR